MSTISIAELSSSTPLIALSAVCLDTETTGLDTSVARIIQIGGVRLEKGRLNKSNHYDQLVRPDVTIPPETTAIHGLTDQDVAEAPVLADVAGGFMDWVSSSVWLGYSIGFDLAVFEREFERAERIWIRPRALDVRHLVGIINPNLPDFALETVAAWLDVPVENRHTALGDAIITANVFLGLLPHLRERNIFTLAEAEAACREIIRKADLERAAGWREAVPSEETIRKSFGALARIDSYPYRHRVSDVMSAPVITVPADLSLREVLSILIDQRISSVLVEPGAKGEGLGIITERDILRAVNDAPTAALKKKAADLAIRPVAAVAADDFVYRAVSHMSRLRYRHLGVTDATGRVTGMVTSRDLLKQRAEDAIALGEGLHEARSAEDLALVWSRLTLVAGGLVREDVDPRDCAAVISRELCALTRHACRIAEQELADSGEGAAPRPYALFVLGSGGRGESMLAMDQDNAMVYADSVSDDADTVDQWFAKLGGRTADILHLAGVPYCKGGVMARNDDWRMPIGQWKKKVSHWISRHKPEHILNTDIFFDAVPVHGDTTLAEELLDHAFEAGARSRDFLQLMSMNAARIDLPLGMFGGFKLRDGRMDLKGGGILPIFSTARLLAIRYDVRTLSTPGRLLAVRNEEGVNENAIDKLIEAHRVLLGAILNQQLLDIEEGIPPSNLVDPKSMSVTDREQIKWALRQLDAVAGLLGDPIAMH